MFANWARLFLIFIAQIKYCEVRGMNEFLNEIQNLLPLSISVLTNLLMFLIVFFKTRTKVLQKKLNALPDWSLYEFCVDGKWFSLDVLSPTLKSDRKEEKKRWKAGEKFILKDLIIQCLDVLHNEPPRRILPHTITAVELDCNLSIFIRKDNVKNE